MVTDRILYMLSIVELFNMEGNSIFVIDIEEWVIFTMKCEVKKHKKIFIFYLI